VGAERWGCEPEVKKRIHKHSFIRYPNDEKISAELPATPGVVNTACARLG